MVAELSRQIRSWGRGAVYLAKKGFSSRVSNREKSMQTQFGNAVISRMIAIRLNGDRYETRKKCDKSVKWCFTQLILELTQTFINKVV